MQPTIGILVLETRFPRLHGDAGNPSTWPFPVRIAVVAGALREHAAVCERRRERIERPGLRLVFDGLLVRARIAAARIFLPMTLGATTLEYAAKVRTPFAVLGIRQCDPLPLIIPCHRVVAAGNRLGGFMRGRGDHALSIKRWLLVHEGFL